VTYAVHRMEEEGARRKKYNGRGGAGGRGFLGGLNEDEEEETGSEEDNAAGDRGRRQHGDYGGRAGPRDLGKGRKVAQAGANGVTVGSARRGFELDMDGATLLGRRHKKTVGVSSPLAGKPAVGHSPLGKGAEVPSSPMRI